MEQTECSETSAYKIQTPGNYPEENIQQNFSKILDDGFTKNAQNIIFHENRSRGSRVVPCGQTDGQTRDEADSRFWQFCRHT